MNIKDEESQEQSVKQLQSDILHFTSNISLRGRIIDRSTFSRVIIWYFLMKNISFRGRIVIWIMMITFWGTRRYYYRRRQKSW